MGNWQDLPALTAELLRRGQSEGDLHKIYHQDFIRVLRDAEQR
jgi:microsomal dipeptidase-like Zn-dependent dipeptidase